MATENLWGTLPDVSQLRTPVEILNEQATVLTGLTHGVLQGSVDARGGTDKLAVDLDIVVPALGGYSFTILTVTHGVRFYPATVQYYPANVTYSASNDSQFVEILKGCLGSKEVREVIASLLLQAKQAS